MKNNSGDVFTSTGIASVSAPTAENSGPVDPGGGTDGERYTNAKAVANSYPNGVYDDADLVAESGAIDSLIDRSEATIVCVVGSGNSGNWATAATWYDGTTNRIPQADDKVLIPFGTTVTYDVTDGSEVNVDWIKCDGKFIFDHSADRTLSYGTVHVANGGEFECGTDVSPVPPTSIITLYCHEDGDMDVVDDPHKIGRGFVNFHGKSTIVGAAKAEFARAVGSPSATDTTITLREAKTGMGIVTGWEVGDELVITGTIVHGWGPSQANNVDEGWRDWENEVVTITSIDVTTPSAPVVTFTPALIFDHPPCFKRADLTCHALNMTRNIKLAGAGGAAQPWYRRTHNLFKSDEVITLKYFEVRSSGRTHHTYISGDADFGAIVQAPSNQLPDSDANPVNSPAYLSAYASTPKVNYTGRYPVHLHRSGFDTLEGAPHVIEGLVIVDGESWGGVHHDTFANWSRCIAYDCKSAGFAAEGGGNIGKWQRMFACGSKPSYRNYATAKTKDGGADFGQLGNGYWINSRTLNVEECTSSNCNNGFPWTSRPNFGTNVYPGVTDEVRAFYGLAENPTTVVARSFPVIEGFLDNEAYACPIGMSVVKAQPNQHHDLRTHLDGFTAWECHIGAHLGYTAHYNLVNFDLIGLNPAPKIAAGHKPTKGDNAINISAHDMDMVVNQPNIEEFGTGIGYSDNSPHPLAVNRGNVIIEPTFDNVAVEYDVYTDKNISITSFPYSIPDQYTADPNTYEDIIFITAASLPAAPGGGNITYDWQAVEDQMSWVGGQNKFMLFGELTDSLGIHKRYLGRPLPSKTGGLTVIDEQSDIHGAGKVTSNYGILLLIDQDQMEAMIRAEGYYDSTAGDKVLLIPDVAQDRLDGSTTYFYSPVALRMPQADLDAWGAVSNGALADGSGQEYDGFNPAGTPGTT